MERQRGFSFKCTRFLMFSFTISSFIIILTFFFHCVIKFTLFIKEDTRFQLNKPAVNASLKPISVQTLTGFSRNFTATNVKNLVLIDSNITRPDSAARLVNISVSRDIQAEGNDTKVLQNDGSRNDDLNAIRSSPGQESASPPFLEEITVQTNEKLEEKKIREASVEKIKLPSDQQIKMKKIRTTSVKQIEGVINQRIEEKRTKDCDITKGRWVYDDSYPLYTNATCPLIDESFNCMTNGRQDKDYMKWKWQPQDCDIPRFNTKMLELIRGKRRGFCGRFT